MTPSKEKLKTNGLVIRENNIVESDRVVTLLTRDMGVIRAFSSGSRDMKNKKFSGSAMLSYSDFSLIKSGDTYKINEASLIKSFFDVASDIVPLSLAQYFCELSLSLVPEGTESEEALRLILNSLHFLTEKKKNLFLIKAITELRFMYISGYMPDLVACSSCSEYEADIMYFDVSSGSLLCEKCKTDSSFLIPVNRTMLSAMRHIVFSDFSQIYSFSVPDEDAKALSFLTEKYLIHQTEKKYRTLAFFNSIL